MADQMSRKVGERTIILSTAAGVLAAATNFEHAGLLGFLAVLTTIFAAFFGRTVTGRMSTSCLVF